MKVSLPLKSIIFLLVTITISSATAAVTTHFRDVQPGSWYEEGVNTMNERGVMNGYSNGLFGVNDPVTRAQLATILNRYSYWTNKQIRALQRKLSLELENGPWEKYIKEFYYFPDLEVHTKESYLVTDAAYFEDKKRGISVKLSGQVDGLDIFYIISGSDFFGPFHDDAARLKKEATGS